MHHSHIVFALALLGCGPSARGGLDANNDQGGNFDLDQVKSGSLSLSATINQVVLDSYCQPPIL